MNIPEHVKGGRELIPGQFFDLTLPIGHPGLLTVLAAALRRSFTLAEAAHCRVELFGPGGIQPIAFREIEGLGMLAILEHEVKGGAGLWTVRITNYNSHPLQVILEASYPGVGDLQPLTLPAHFLEAVAGRLLSGISVSLQHGRNACSIRFSPALGLRDFRFSIPALDRRVSPPLHPKFKLLNKARTLRAMPSACACCLARLPIREEHFAWNSALKKTVPN